MALTTVLGSTLPWISQSTITSGNTSTTGTGATNNTSTATSSTAGTTFVASNAQTVAQSKLWANPQSSSKLPALGQLFDLANVGAGTYVSIDELSSMLAQVETTWIASNATRTTEVTNGSAAMTTAASVATNTPANGSAIAGATQPTNGAAAFSSPLLASTAKTTTGATLAAPTGNPQGQATKPINAEGARTNGTAMANGANATNGAAMTNGANATIGAAMTNGANTTNGANAQGTTNGWAQAALDPADENGDGVVTAAEQAIYDMTHPNTPSVFAA